MFNLVWRHNIVAISIVIGNAHVDYPSIMGLNEIGTAKWMRGGGGFSDPAQPLPPPFPRQLYQTPYNREDYKCFLNRRQEVSRACVN